MKEISNELKIGLVVLAAVIVAFLGFRFMQDEPLFSSVKLVYTKFDNVGGLVRGNSVYLNGFKIGSVREMEYLGDVDSVQVVLSITEPISIPVGSKAVLMPPSFIGSPVIEIRKSDSPVFIEWSTYIEGIQEEGLLDSITEEGTEVVDSVQVAIAELNKFIKSLNELEEEKGGNIGEMIDDISSSVNTVKSILDERKSEIDSIIVAAENTLNNVSELSDSSFADVESMISNLEAFSTDLDSLSLNLQNSTLSLNSILEKMDNGEGTLGLMLNDPSLYNNLDNLTVNLNELIQAIQENPGEYLKHMRLVDIF